MAGTDDIAERVANMFIEPGVQILSAAGSMISPVIKGVGAASSMALSQMIEHVKRNQELRRLMGIDGEISAEQMNKLIHKFSEKSSTVMVGDSDAKDFETLLNDQKVLYAKLDKVNDDCKMFIFLNKDTEKVENVATLLRAQRGQVSELRPDLYFNTLSPDKVHALDGISPVEMELFRHYAREGGLLFTAISRKDDYMVVCDQADTDRARKAMLRVGWALTGANGAKIRQQVERRLAGRSAIQISAEEGERELYIVSGKRPSQYVKISTEDYTFYKQNMEVSRVSRSDPDFYVKCMAACEGLAHPVVMSPSQFREDFTPEDLESAHTIDLFPEFFEDQQEMQQLNRLVDLVAMKSGLDDNHNATWGLWDPSVSYSEFASYEYISDEDELDARKYEFEHFKQAAYYSSDHHTSHEVDMEEKNLDYIIAKAEEKRKSMLGREAERSGISYDWNPDSVAVNTHDYREA